MISRVLPDLAVTVQLSPRLPGEPLRAKRLAAGPSPAVTSPPAVLRTWPAPGPGYPDQRPVGVRPDGSFWPYLVIVSVDPLELEGPRQRIFCGSETETSCVGLAEHLTQTDKRIAKALGREPRHYQARRADPSPGKPGMTDGAV